MSWSLGHNSQAVPKVWGYCIWYEIQVSNTLRVDIKAGLIGAIEVIAVNCYEVLKCVVQIGLKPIVAPSPTYNFNTSVIID